MPVSFVVSEHMTPTIAAVSAEITSQEFWLIAVCWALWRIEKLMRWKKTYKNLTQYLYYYY